MDARKVLINDELADDKGTFHFPIQQNNIIDVDATAAGPGFTFSQHIYCVINMNKCYF